MSFGDPWFYIVLLGAAALVYALLLPGRSPAASSKPGVSDGFEATLEQYMAEIERENEELIDLVAQMKQDFTSKQLAHQEQIAELRQRLADVEFTSRSNASRLEQLEQDEQVTAAVQGKISSDIDSTTWKPEVAGAPYNVAEGLPGVAASQVSGLAESIIPATAQPEPSQPDTLEPELTESVRDRYPELFDLYAKGKSVDTIAKSTGLQRGEVQLILQLAKREESR
ncbi:MULTISPECIES: hypothetical protein [Paenibacillus]|uniref:C-type cytochrome biogenesis protein CcmI n=1 Tax=Paenibacillus vini TaxID=1476024 RepID=A0ABQ4M8E8_9BACL|nr:hypothetical protein [Paenibacillus vini]GIP52264.1 hypothetical protein J42TS3_12990 [Paenibacillus vini]